MTACAVEVEQVTVRYGTLLALDKVDLRVEVGTVVAVIGPNGSGKSTLLGAIGGLVPPTSGRINVDRKKVALVLQSTEIDPALPLTVRDVVRMARYPHLGLFRRSSSHDRLAVELAMSRTGVEDLANRQIHSLSGGQRQRVLVAQGLAQEADLLLLDEPVAGLDVSSRLVIREVMEQERSVGRSVVMVTHSLEDAAMCDLVVLLSGRVVAAGAPSDVLVGAHLTEAFELPTTFAAQVDALA